MPFQICADVLFGLARITCFISRASFYYSLKSRRNFLPSMMDHLVIIEEEVSPTEWSVTPAYGTLLLHTSIVIPQSTSFSHFLRLS